MMAALSLAQKRTPDRPDCETLTDDHWYFIQKCWTRDPEYRPTAEEAHKELVRLRQETLDSV